MVNENFKMFKKRLNLKAVLNLTQTLRSMRSSSAKESTPEKTSTTSNLSPFDKSKARTLTPPSYGIAAADNPQPLQAKFGTGFGQSGTLQRKEETGVTLNTTPVEFQKNNNLTPADLINKYKSSWAGISPYPLGKELAIEYCTNFNFVNQVFQILKSYETNFIVPWSSILYAGSVRDNVAMAMYENLTFKQMTSICDPKILVLMEKMIRELPSTYNESDKKVVAKINAAIEAHKAKHVAIAAKKHKVATPKIVDNNTQAKYHITVYSPEFSAALHKNVKQNNYKQVYSLLGQLISGNATYFKDDFMQRIAKKSGGKLSIPTTGGGKGDYGTSATLHYKATAPDGISITGLKFDTNEYGYKPTTAQFFAITGKSKDDLVPLSYSKKLDDKDIKYEFDFHTKTRKQQQEITAYLRALEAEGENAKRMAYVDIGLGISGALLTLFSGGMKTVDGSLGYVFALDQVIGGVNVITAVNRGIFDPNMEYKPVKGLFKYRAGNNGAVTYDLLSTFVAFKGARDNLKTLAPAKAKQAGNYATQLSNGKGISGKELNALASFFVNGFGGASGTVGLVKTVTGN